MDVDKIVVDLLYPTAKVIPLFPCARRTRRGATRMVNKTGSLAEFKKGLEAHLRGLTDQLDEVAAQKRMLDDRQNELEQLANLTRTAIQNTDKLEKDVAAATQPLKVADPFTVKEYVEKSRGEVRQTVLPQADSIVAAATREPAA